MKSEKDSRISDSWSIRITKADNGFVLDYDEEIEEGVYRRTHIAVEDPEDGNECVTTQKLLWEIMEYFGLCGDKHQNERVKVIIEKAEV